MTDLIDVVQKIEPGSELVDLFELTLPDASILYFHPDFDSGNTTIGEEGYIYFREKTTPYDVKSYAPFPINMDGVEFNSDGAQNRPTLTVANVTSAFSDELGANFRNEDLIGQPIVKRTTLKKYLYEPGGSAGAYDATTPPIEFPIQKYIIDRVTGENATAVTFELAAPFDLSGIQLPNRSIIGKYCSWEYQGQDLNSRGGCTWSKNGQQYIGVSTAENNNTSGHIFHKIYFTAKDEPIINKDLFSTITPWAASTYYVRGSLILENNIVYIAKVSHTSGSTFSADSSNWKIGTKTSWASGTSYSIDDYVQNGTDYYRCNTAHTSSSTFSADNWDTVFVWTVYSSGTTYAAGDYVKYSSATQETVWKALKASTGQTPTESTYWTRGDMCGKKFSSCKCRFQYVPVVNQASAYVGLPSTSKNSKIPIPFGAFPGSRKFR